MSLSSDENGSLTLQSIISLEINAHWLGKAIFPLNKRPPPWKNVFSLLIKAHGRLLQILSNKRPVQNKRPWAYSRETPVMIKHIQVTTHFSAHFLN